MEKQLPCKHQILVRFQWSAQMTKQEKKNPDKRFVVRKYIMAQSAADAIKKDKIAPVFDVWVDDDFKKDNEIGFVCSNVK